TGTELGHLTPAVSSGNGSEGPDCPFREAQYTFKAQAATKYEIAVDGDIYHLPEAPVPQTEGQVRLRIDATPPPPNDDFADALSMAGELEEESRGEAFYRDQTFGYNWNATEESGEPSLNAAPSGPSVWSGGASVWYSWTAPISGQVTFYAELPLPGLR